MNLLKASLLAGAIAAAPMVANAESNFESTSTAGTKLSTTARLDFSIVVPKVLFLQVGRGSLLQDDTGVDMLTFDVPAASLGQGPVSATGGDAASGSGVTARLLGNVGTVTLQATTTGALSNGVAGQEIPFSEISAISSNQSGLPVPAFDAAATSITAVNGVINQTAIWTFSYANSNTYAAGTYGGANTNNGRVTYTAAMP